MGAVFEFKCSRCDGFHQGAPSLAFAAPLHFSELTEEERKERGYRKSDDLCSLGEDRFIRVCLEIPIHGMDEGFLWGVWVSLSRPNFQEYQDRFEEEYSAHYFGWLCNNLPSYPPTLSLPTTVHIDGNKSRPLISLNDGQHELHADFSNGISQEKAARIFEKILHRDSAA